MFLVLLKYHSMEAIDALLEQHYANPHGAFAKGLVRLAGRLEPRTGGLMVLDGTREEVERAVARDPFVTSRAATAEIVEFIPTRQISEPVSGS
ncbi:YciI family protein [Allokutzneria sp. NRRL B-24872]|uniref:YciI family protein n=1 Tax=Allokutzneria sp. NRRL B-24872 TaxID=1137961 RepID=UPI000A3CD744|nr:YciI family protein [Allokutzneria sp. NRRL B-24872]